jgi:hypothetical protein
MTPIFFNTAAISKPHSACAPALPHLSSKTAGQETVRQQ